MSTAALLDNPHFIGDVVALWLPDGREMKLKENFLYVDKYGVEWQAPINSIVDGASIPRFFWRYIGSPFVGKYRRASVIHDVYCKTKSRPHERVHKVFKEMMLADGVDEFDAHQMYLAVKVGGPTW